MNFSYHSHTQQSVVYLLYQTVNKMTYSLKWTLDECCWSYFHKCYITLDITIFNNSFSAEGDYECQILLCQVLFVFRQKQLASLNNIRALFKSVLTALGARNFVHVACMFVTVRSICQALNQMGTLCKKYLIHRSYQFFENF